MFGHVHVCRTPDAERVQVLCKCVQRVQVGCCIVQPHVAHSLPIFLSVAVAHGRPWIHNSNNSNIYYNSYKQVGAGVVVERPVERQVDPYKQVGSGVKGEGVKRRLVVV